MARLQNSYAETPNDPFTSLIYPITGAAIPDMPATLDAMNGELSSTLISPPYTLLTNFTVPQITAVLQQLGQVVPDTQGEVAQVRRQLRIEIGLQEAQV